MAETTLVKPHPGEIWYVESPEIELGIERAVTDRSKIRRPCIIVSHLELIRDQQFCFNVLPLSSQGSTSKYRVPVRSSFEILDPTFEVASKSFAIINLYQPIKLEAFTRRVGRIDLITYEKIQHLICTTLVGYIHFNI